MKENITGITDRRSRKPKLNVFTFKRRKMRKFKLSRFLSVLFSLNNRFPARKKVHSNAESFLIGLRKISRRRFNIIDPNLNEKNVVNYITTRNMRKTITPALIERNVSNQNDTMNPITMNKIMNLIARKWKQSEQQTPLYSMSSLKVHTNSNLLGNLITKEPEGTVESRVEEEEAWGGQEAFKSITFLKEDFEAVLSKIPDSIVFFYAFWCPHCLRLKRPYGNAALLSKEARLKMVFAAFDVTINPEIADEKGVVGIPMIKYYQFGKFISNYSGKRTTGDLFEFAKNPPTGPKIDKRPDV